MTIGSDNSILCNLLKEQDEILEFQDGHILKRLGDLIIKQKDKELHYRIKSRIKRLDLSSSPKSRSWTFD